MFQWDGLGAKDRSAANTPTVLSETLPKQQRNSIPQRQIYTLQTMMDAGVARSILNGWIMVRDVDSVIEIRQKRHINPG